MKAVCALAGTAIAVAIIAPAALARATTPPTPAPTAPAPTSTTNAPTAPIPAKVATIAVDDEAFPDDIVVTGATFKLRGDGWTPNTLIQLEVCGSSARSGTSDCAVGTAQIVASDSAGSFRARIAVVVPPTPCPCVVRAMSESTGTIATAKVKIAGAPEVLPGDGTVVAPALRTASVSGVSLQGSDSWSSWFGGHPRRTLQFTVTNTGDVALAGAAVSVTFGSSDDVTGFVAPVKIDTLKVGEKRVYRIPVEFDALAFGKQVVQGTITGTSSKTAFAASTSSHPWLLMAIPALLVLQLPLLLIRNLVRRWLHRKDAASPDEGESDPAEPIPLEPTDPGAAAGAPEPPPELADTDADTDGDDDVVYVGMPAVRDEWVVDTVDTTPAADHVEPEFDPTDECLVCVLEFSVRSTGGNERARRTYAVVRGVSATKRFLTCAEADVATEERRVRDDIEVVSLLAGERSTVRDAYEASAELGQWIEAEVGLFRRVGEATRTDSAVTPRGIDSGVRTVDHWGDEDISSRMFVGRAHERVDLHGLIPLAVYTRMPDIDRPDPADPWRAYDKRNRLANDGPESFTDVIDEWLALGSGQELDH